MRPYIYIAIMLLQSFNCAAQKNFLPAGKVNAAFIDSITSKCCTESKKWSYTNGTAVRHYDNGFDYTLIDTAGLFVYVKTSKNNTIACEKAPDAFFSKDACGEIYRLNYTSLKRCFREYIEFTKVLKEEKDEALSLPAKSDDITLVNCLYKELVRGRHLD